MDASHLVSGISLPSCHLNRIAQNIPSLVGTEDRFEGRGTPYDVNIISDSEPVQSQRQQENGTLLFFILRYLLLHLIIFMS